MFLIRSETEVEISISYASVNKIMNFITSKQQNLSYTSVKFVPIFKGLLTTIVQSLPTRFDQVLQ